MNTRISDEVRESVYQDYRAGLTYRKIEEKHDISHRSATVIIKELAAAYGEPRRSPHVIRSAEEIATRNEKIDEMYKARYSSKEIAEALGCTRTIVNNFLRKKYGSARRVKQMEPKRPTHGRVAPMLKPVELPRGGDLTVEKVMHFRDSTKVGEIINIRDYSVVIHKGTMHRTYKFRNLSCRVVQKSRYVVITTAGTFPWKMCTIM